MVCCRCCKVPGKNNAFAQAPIKVATTWRRCGAVRCSHRYSQARTGEHAARVRGHVVRSFTIMAANRIAVGREARHDRFEIAPHARGFRRRALRVATPGVGQRTQGETFEQLLRMISVRQ
jgi:hypothetical protein